MCRRIVVKTAVYLLIISISISVAVQHAYSAQNYLRPPSTGVRADSPGTTLTFRERKLIKYGVYTDAELAKVRGLYKSFKFGRALTPFTPYEKVFIWQYMILMKLHNPQLDLFGDRDPEPTLFEKIDPEIRRLAIDYEVDGLYIGYSWDDKIRYQDKADSVLDSIRIRAGDRVLDIGCGEGNVIIDLARLHRDVEFVGIDASPFNISKVIDSLIGLGRQAPPNVKFHIKDVRFSGPGMDIPNRGILYPDGYFDLIMLLEGVMDEATYHKSWYELVWKEAIRVARKPGAKIIFFGLKGGSILHSLLPESIDAEPKNTYFSISGVKHKYHYPFWGRINEYRSRGTGLCVWELVKMKPAPKKPQTAVASAEEKPRGPVQLILFDESAKASSAGTSSKPDAVSGARPAFKSREELLKYRLALLKQRGALMRARNDQTAEAAAGEDAKSAIVADEELDVQALPFTDKTENILEPDTASSENNRKKQVSKRGKDGRTITNRTKAQRSFCALLKQACISGPESQKAQALMRRFSNSGIKIKMNSAKGNLYLFSIKRNGSSESSVTLMGDKKLYGQTLRLIPYIGEVGPQKGVVCLRVSLSGGKEPVSEEKLLWQGYWDNAALRFRGTLHMWQRKTVRGAAFVPEQKFKINPNYKYNMAEIRAIIPEDALPVYIIEEFVDRGYISKDADNRVDGHAVKILADTAQEIRAEQYLITEAARFTGGNITAHAIRKRIEKGALYSTTDYSRENVYGKDNIIYLNREATLRLALEGKLLGFLGIMTEKDAAAYLSTAPRDMKNIKDRSEGMIGDIQFWVTLDDQKYFLRRGIEALGARREAIAREAEAGNSVSIIDIVVRLSARVRGLDAVEVLQGIRELDLKHYDYMEEHPFFILQKIIYVGNMTPGQERKLISRVLSIRATKKRLRQNGKTVKGLPKPLQLKDIIGSGLYDNNRAGELLHYSPATVNTEFARGKRPRVLLHNGNMNNNAAVNLIAGDDLIRWHRDRFPASPAKASSAGLTVMNESRDVISKAATSVREDLGGALTKTDRANRAVRANTGQPISPDAGRVIIRPISGVMKNIDFAA